MAPPSHRAAASTWVSTHIPTMQFVLPVANSKFRMLIKLLSKVIRILAAKQCRILLPTWASQGRKDSQGWQPRQKRSALDQKLCLSSREGKDGLMASQSSWKISPIHNKIMKENHRLPQMAISYHQSRRSQIAMASFIRLRPVLHGQINIKELMVQAVPTVLGTVPTLLGKFIQTDNLLKITIHLKKWTWMSLLLTIQAHQWVLCRSRTI